jgi:hypothetical protein
VYLRSDPSIFTSCGRISLPFGFIAWWVSGDYFSLFPPRVQAFPYFLDLGMWTPLWFPLSGSPLSQVTITFLLEISWELSIAHSNPYDVGFYSSNFWRKGTSNTFDIFGFLKCHFLSVDLGTIPLTSVYLLIQKRYVNSDCRFGFYVKNWS